MLTLCRLFLPDGREKDGRKKGREKEQMGKREKKDVAVEDIKADLKEMRRREGPNNISREEPGRSDLMIGAFFN